MGTISETLADREEIRELYARYAHSIDAAQFDEWVECFTEDGVFESPRLGKHRGRDGLRKFCAMYKESWGGAKPMHLMSNVSIAVNGDRAAGGCYLAYFHCKAGKAEFSAVGHYTDKLRKVNGRWRFEHRQVAIDGAP